VPKALKQLPGCIGAACTYYLTAFETGRSNTIDNVLETASGGHQVDVNNNTVDGDEVTYAFDADANEFSDLSGVTLGTDGGTSYFKTLFDTYDLSFNGVSHLAWTGSNVQSYGHYSSGVGDQRTLNNTVNVIQGGSCESLDNCTGNREPGLFHDVVYEQNGDGSIWYRWDNYIISDTGEIARHSAFSNVTSGAVFKRRLLALAERC